jgi:hypothetical protein
MRFCILDPMLGEKLVGHAAYTRDIARELKMSWKDEVAICTRVNLSEKVRSYIGTDYEYHKLFLSTPFEQWSGQSLTPDYHAHRSRKVAENNSVLNALKGTQANFFPTAFPTQVAAAAKIKQEKYTAFLFHYSLREFSDSYLLLQTGVLRSLQNPDSSKIHVFANNSGLATEFAELGIPCQTVPYIHYANRSAGAVDVYDDRTIVGFFGHQRAVKDDGLLSSSVISLLDSGISVLFHSSEKDVLPFEHPNLKKITGFVPPDKFPNMIRQCKLTVITNQPKYFDKKLSGVTVESLAAGVPVVVPADTHMERLSRRYSAGVSYHSRDPASLVGCVKYGLKHLPTLLSGAEVASRHLNEEHGLKAYISAVRNHAADHS